MSVRLEREFDGLEINEVIVSLPQLHLLVGKISTSCKGPCARYKRRKSSLDIMSSDKPSSAREVYTWIALVESDMLEYVMEERALTRVCLFGCDMILIFFVLFLR